MVIGNSHDLHPRYFFFLFLKPEDAARGNPASSHRPILGSETWEEEGKTTRDLGPRRFRPARRARGLTKVYVAVTAHRVRRPLFCPPASMFLSVRARPCSFLRRKYAHTPFAVRAQGEKTSQLLFQILMMGCWSVATVAVYLVILALVRRAQYDSQARGAANGEAGWKN